MRLRQRLTKGGHNKSDPDFQLMSVDTQHLRVAFGPESQITDVSKTYYRWRWHVLDLLWIHHHMCAFNAIRIDLASSGQTF